MAYTTRIDRAVFDARFKNYDNAETEVEKQLSIRAKQIADQAKTTAENVRDEIDEVKNDVVYKIEFHSTKGFTFRNGEIDTDITARVWRGKTEITDTVPKAGFIWKKFDKDGVLDTTWTNAHIGIGNKIHVTNLEVYQRAIFTCDIDM